MAVARLEAAFWRRPGRGSPQERLHLTTQHYTTLHYLRASVEHASSHDACLAPLAHPWYPAPRCPFQLSVEDVQRVLDCAPADDDNILLQGDASFYTVVRPLSWGL